MSTTQIVPTSDSEIQDNGMQLMLVGDPQKQVDQATRACDVLMKIVESKALFEEFGRGKDRKRHLKVEAWLLLAHFFGVTTRTESVMSVQDDATNHFGFEAIVEAVHTASGRLLGRAVCRCMSNEENWGMVTKYEWEGEQRKVVGERQKAMQQLESMAQTRATSKVLASLFRWVVILGAKDVSGTPAEEMGGKNAKVTPVESQGGANRITDKQRKRIFGVAHGVGMPIDNLPGILEKHGFKQAHEVTVDKYDAVVADVQNWKAVSA